MENQYRERLVLYREIATSLAYSYMNHEQRGKQIEILKTMLWQEREKYEECDYRNTLSTLLGLLDFIKQDGLTHSDVKGALHLFVTVTQNAISRPESIWSVRARKPDRLELQVAETNLSGDDIPF